MSELDTEHFKFLAEIIKSYSGISLTEDKAYLVEGRLLPVAQKYGLGSISNLVDCIKENRDESFMIEIIEAMTTNESFFFRDEKSFECLANSLIPQVLQKLPGKKSLKIWSAACSTGQEVYSTIMTIIEKPEFADISFEIFATDLDFNVIEKAKEGLYTQFEVQRGMPIALLVKYFTQEGDQWRVKDVLRQKVKFEKFNLLDNPGAFGKFDVVFCRNVLIYFDSPTKEKVINNLVSCMESNSSLLLGAAESLLNLDTKLVPYKDSEGKPISGIFVFE